MNYIIKKMAEKTLVKRANRFQIYDKQADEKKSSEVIDSLYINEIKTDDSTFTVVDVKTKDGVYHQAFLNDPVSETKKELDKKISSLTQEQQEELLNKL